MHFHDTMESLYKSIDMELLPDEYLPDDYKGPSAGPLKQIIRTYSHNTLWTEIFFDIQSTKPDRLW